MYIYIFIDVQVNCVPSILSFQHHRLLVVDREWHMRRAGQCKDTRTRGGASADRHCQSSEHRSDHQSITI